MATKHKNQVRFPLLVAPQTFDYLQDLANESNSSISGYLRNLIADHLELLNQELDQ